jgi:nucleoside-diphosphate-sugar epimerase
MRDSVSMDILVIGGTGPTGPHIVNGLVDRGHTVTILHTGNHEVDTIPAHLEHIHTDPFDEQKFTDAISGRTFDVVFAMYGRLRMISRVLEGRTPRVFSIGGVPGYEGFSEPDAKFPSGMVIPTDEDQALVTDDRSGLKPRKIAESEQLVFDHHPDATHFRYPYIYGPNQILPREWTLVKRALDGRRRLILPDGGLSLVSSAFVENATHAVLLGIDHIDASAGQIYNVGDDTQLSLTQIAEIVADELGHTWDMVSIPWDQAPSTGPWMHNHSSHHRLLSTEKIRAELQYRDQVSAEEGLRRTVQWQVDHLPGDEAVAHILQDPYDYDAEDQVLAAHDRFVESVGAIAYDLMPGWTYGYYGPRDNPGGKRGSFRL